MNRDARASAVVGRHARLDLAFVRRNGRTVVAHAYAEPPLRVGPAFDLGDAVYLILVCTGPGVFPGDRLHHRISVGRGARAVLVSQSALQIHPSRDVSPAVVLHEYQIEDEGELHCQWDPVVPFAGARLVQRFDVQVASGGRLYWSDALMSGRVGRGESWQFESIDHELRLSIGGTVRYLERSRLVPAEGRLPRPWVAGESHYMGTTILHHDAATLETAETLHHDLAGIDRLSAAVDLVEARLILGRFLSAEGVAFSTGRAAFRERALDAVFRRPDLVARR